MVTSPDMRERAGWLAEEFTRRGIAHHRIDITALWDAQTTRDILEARLANFPVRCSSTPPAAAKS